MAITWSDFVGGVSDRRFVLPVWEFDYHVEYVPVLFDDAVLPAIANLVSAAAVDAMRTIKDCPLSSLHLSTTSPTKPGATTNEKSETSYFTLINGAPPYDFAIKLGQSIMAIEKIRSNLADIIATLPLFERLCSTLFPPHTTSASSDNPTSLGDVLAIREKGHRVTFSFSHRLCVAHRITQQHREVKNVEVIAKMARTTGTAAPNYVDAPIAALQPVEFYKGNVELIMEKTIGGRARSIWVDVNAPYNIQQRDVDLHFAYRAGGGRTELRPEDLVDWTTPFVDFYREIILNQFMPFLFHDTALEARIA